MSREPVLILDFIKAFIAVAIVFGLDLPVGADIALVGLSTAFLAILQGQSVTPVASPNLG